MGRQTNEILIRLNKSNNIRQKHGRVVTFSRSFIIQGGVAPLKIIGMDVVSDGDPRFSDIIVLGQVGFLILKAAEPPFNHDIIRPAAIPIDDSCQI